ncbi:Transcriptional regulatory protein FixJ [compost metagenome]
MPGISGLAVLDTLMAQGVDQPVIMLTGHGTMEICRRAFKVGAAEFLEKPVDDEALLEALQNAVRQHVRTRQRHQADRAARERHAQLSEREREVLDLVAQAMPNKKIARVLGVTPHTVKWHLRKIYSKLGVAERDEAVARMRDLSLVRETPRLH